VNQETGEHFFSPKTIEKIQKLVLGNPKPQRTIMTPVLSFLEQLFAQPECSPDRRLFSFVQFIVQLERLRCFMTNLQRYRQVALFV
jgi:hypothetical protein